MEIDTTRARLPGWCSIGRGTLQAKVALSRIVRELRHLESALRSSPTLFQLFYPLRDGVASLGICIPMFAQ